MKSRIISLCLCLVALGISMLMTVKLINSDKPMPPEKSTEHKKDENTPDPISPLINAEIELTEGSIASFARRVEQFIDKMAYGADKSYEADIEYITSNLDRVADHLLSPEIGDKAGSEYISTLSEGFKDANKGYSGDAVFSAKVSALLKNLDDCRANITDSSSIYPKLDTEVGGDLTLALLAIYEDKSIAADGTTFTVTVGGGALLGDALSTTESMKFAKQTEKYTHNYPFHAISAVTASDDATFIALEAPLTMATESDSTNPVKGLPEYASRLQGIDAVSIASNNVMQYGSVGFDETVKALKDNGISYSVQNGSQLLEKEFGKVVYITFDLTDSPISDEEKEKNKEIVRNAVATEKNNGAELVIVLIHWNTRQRKSATSDDYLNATSVYEPHFDAYNKEIARAAIGDGRTGADLVVGYGSRVAQGIELRNNKMIVYQTGDLSYSGTLDSEKNNTEQAFLFRQTFVKSDAGVTSLSYRIIPIVNTSEDGLYLPRIVFDERADEIIDTLIYQSRYFGDASISSFNYISIKK